MKDTRKLVVINIEKYKYKCLSLYFRTIHESKELIDKLSEIPNTKIIFPKRNFTVKNTFLKRHRPGLFNNTKKVLVYFGFYYGIDENILTLRDIMINYDYEVSNINGNCINMLDISGIKLFTEIFSYTSNV